MDELEKVIDEILRERFDLQEWAWSLDNLEIMEEEENADDNTTI